MGLAYLEENSSVIARMELPPVLSIRDGDRRWIVPLEVEGPAIGRGLLYCVWISEEAADTRSRSTEDGPCAAQTADWGDSPNVVIEDGITDSQVSAEDRGFRKKGNSDCSQRLPGVVPKEGQTTTTPHLETQPTDSQGNSETTEEVTYDAWLTDPSVVVGSARPLNSAS